MLGFRVIGPFGLSMGPTPQGMDPRAAQPGPTCGARHKLQFKGSYFSVALIVWELWLNEVIGLNTYPL